MSIVIHALMSKLSLPSPVAERGTSAEISHPDCKASVKSAPKNPSNSPTMDIYRLNALSDNYVFLLHDPARNTAAVVDPAEGQPVLQKLDELGATLVAIFNTHHHGDHVGGNRQLLHRFPDATVYASAVDQGRIPAQHVYLNEGDTVTFADRTAQVFFVPGHTRGHIAYYFPPTEARHR